MAKVFSISGHTISYGGFKLRETGFGTLTITKTVDGIGFDPEKTFELVVTFNRPISYTVDGVAIPTASSTYTAHLAHGQSVVLGSIPEATRYSVEETPLSDEDIDLGYHIGSIDAPSGSIPYNRNTTATAGNTYMRPLPEATIRVRFSNLEYAPSEQSEISYVDAGKRITYMAHWSQVSSEPNIWDCTTEAGVTTWNFLLQKSIGEYADTGYVDIIQANANGIESFKYMSQGTALRSVSNFDARNCTDCGGMLMYSKYLETVTDLYLGNAGSLGMLFYECHNLVSLPRELNTSSCTNFDGMYWGCRKLQEIPKMDTRLATTASEMYSYCESLVDIPDMETPLVTDMGGMFSGCSSLKRVPHLDVDSLTYAASLLQDCVSVEEGIYELYTRMLNCNFSSGGHDFAFRNCGTDTESGAAELALIPSDWK